ncbi:7-carboxy-7-deazaguanine synthase [hydrothermal vent metagenome]|uniref:7-carboxy-7-deazaguanine synthase n=1 Tax=hydrothermal vent metagenome TaxID=652676 RepID=A0A3B1CPE0_9ZZZZ
MLKINEIFHSIQGESTYAGRRCVFVRLTYCNLRCTYCDTEYAFYDGVDKSIETIIEEVKEFNCSLVEITGGEPLMQDESLELMKDLCDLNFEVMLETGGSLPIKSVDDRVKIVMDLKTPSSGMIKKNLYENINFIKKSDEIKFVIGSWEDYEWAKEIIEKYQLNKKCQILFSVVFSRLEPVTLSGWILKDKLDVIFQLQMHKYIWEHDKRGV